MVTTLGLWLYVQHSNYQSFRRELVEFCGVQLGASRAEVRYALGNPHWVTEDVEVKQMPGFYRTYEVSSTDGPSMIPKGKSIEDFYDWEWKQGEESVNVIFDRKTNVVKHVVCYVIEDHGNFPDCEGIGSIYAGDIEDSVVDAIGEPDRIEFPEGTTTKTLIYTDIGLEVDLSKRKVFRWTKSKPKELGLWWWLTHGRPS